MALSGAKMAAMAAYMAAMTASGAAADAVAAIEDSSASDVASHTRATDAAADAAAAATAATDANTAAQAATESADAIAAQADAEAARDAAVAAQTAAVGFAGMVATAKQVADDVAKAVADEEMALSGAQMAAMTAADAARTAADAAATAASEAATLAGATSDEAVTAQAAADLAEAAAKTAEAANTVAQAATASEDAMAAQGIAETAQGDAETAMGNAATAQAAAQVVADVAAAADKVADATTSAGTKTEAITAEGGQETDAGIGTENYATVIAVAHKDGAVSISVSRGEGDDKVDFVKMASLRGADRSTGSMNVLGPNDDGETEIAIVYTDIGVPTDIPFAGEGGRYTLDANNTTADPVVSQSLNFNDQQNHNDGRVVLTDSRVTVPAPSGSVTLLSDDENTDDVKENRYAGTFDGATGTFTCTAASGGCAVTVVGGKITGMTSVHFTPDKGEKVTEPDGDYLHYGVWLMKTAQDDGSDKYNEVQTFAFSSIGAVTDVSGVVGTASYKGGAAGVYVRNVYVPSTVGEKKLDHANSGHFTAAVNLTASFAGTSVAEDDRNSIKGTIDGFTLSGGEDASGWGVNVDAEIAVNAGTASGMAKGGGTDPGSFSANFHGADTGDTDNDANTPEVAIGPKVLVGEFNAEFTNGSVAGGFGARKQ